MRLILTGGTGFLGQYLLRDVAKEKEIEVMCLSSRDSFQGFVNSSNIEYINKDLAPVSDYFNWADSFIHLAAAIPSYGKIAEHEYLYTSIDNIRMTVEYLEQCKNHNVKNVVLASSIAVYGNKGFIPYIEDQFEDVNTIYGAYKLSIEKYARYFIDSHEMNIKSLRISQVYGARKKIKNPFLRMCTENALNNQPITVFDTGETAMDYVYVKDVCRAIILAIKCPTISGEYNIGSGRAITANEMAYAHAKGLGKCSSVVHLDNGKEKMVHRALNIAKAKEYFGYVPFFSPLEACEDMAGEYLHPEMLPD